MKNYIVIVSCYGLIHKSRTKEELNGLDSYIRSFSSYINELDTKPRAIVLCGGRTAPEMSAQSESESMLEYIIEKKLMPDQHVLVETTSHNTYEHLAFGIAHVRKVMDSDSVLLCVCDTARFEKVSLEANILLGDYFDIEVQGFDREDVSENSNRETQLFVALPEDLKSREFTLLKEYVQEIIINAPYIDSPIELDDSETEIV